MMEPVTETDVDAAEAPVTSRRRVDKTLLLLSFVIALGLVLVVRGMAISLTGDARAHLPVELESVEPVPDAVQVLSQTRVFADLIEGYTGVFVIDGVELPTINIDDLTEQFDAEPGQQLELPATTIYEPGNATLTFQPSKDALVTKFDSGPHQATVIYWKITDGRQFSSSYSWTFNVV